MISQTYFDKIKSHFGGDIEKTWKWFTSRNPNLGQISPLEMLKTGKTEQLKNFIDKHMVRHG